MKNENIPADVKSKSIKEAKDEINDILNKLERKEVDLVSSVKEYQRLIQLNKHVENILKEKGKKISSMNKTIKSNNDKR